MGSINKTSGDKLPLLVLGDFAWDVLIRTNSELLPGGDAFGEVMFAPGGSAANTAVWAQRCGFPTSFVGKIGQDRFGQMARENLQWEKVDAHLIETDQHRTAAVAVWIDHQGQRSMVSGRGADFYLLSSELPLHLIEQANHLFITAWSLFTDPPRTAALRAAEIVKQQGGTVSLDPASFQMLSNIGRDKCLGVFRQVQPDIFFPNQEEGQILTGQKEPNEIIETLAGYFPSSIIALKLDAQGALINQNGKKYPIDPATDTVIDATGAGDSFAGAFLSRYLSGLSAQKAAEFAVKISSWVINKTGARPSPDKELKGLLNHKQNRK